MLMKQMRDNTKWIMLVTALAFVALMVFEWGMDISGISSGTGEIGRVGSSSVTLDAYNATYRNLYDQVSGSQAEPVSSQQNREIENAAWDEVVNQILIQQELRRRGIVVTDEEIRQAALFAPPPEFRNAAAFQTDGQFDLAKYQQFISSSADNTLLLQLEAYYRDIIPRGKLLRQVTSGIQVSDAKLWRSYRDENERAEVAFIALNPLARVADDRAPVSRREVEDYYRANREDFRIPATATVRIAALAKAPTAEDSAAVVQRAEELRAAILAGEEDFAEVATRESADQGSAAMGGELGTVFPGQAVAPFDSAVFNGPVGQLQAPVRTNFGVHLIQVTQRWGSDSAQVSHILLPMERSDASEMRLLARADSLERMGQDRPLADVAQLLGVEVQETEITEEFPLVPVAGQAGEGAEWALQEAEPGEVSPVFETQQAFYALELLRTRPEGYQTVDEVAPIIEGILRAEKKQAIVAEEGNRWVEEVRAGRKTFQQIAEENGLDVVQPPAFSRVDFVPGLGRQNAAVGAAFGLEPGQVSGVVATESNAFILQGISRTEADREAFEQIKPVLRIQAVQAIQQQRLGEWLDGLRAATRVVDRRQEVFRAAEEADGRPQMPLVF
jgi:peptidyl-prolyl cis-trans isomerase D